MAECKVKLDIATADTLGVIQYLLAEIKEEREYNERYPIAEKEVKKREDEDGGYWWDYMYNAGYTHEPRHSVIKDDAKTIRRLLLKLSK